MTEQFQQGLAEAMKEIDNLRGTVESLQEMASEAPESETSGAPDIEAEVNRRVAARMRALAEEMEPVSEAAEGTTEPDTPDTPEQEEHPAAPGFLTDDSGDYVLAETVAEAQGILGQVESEEYGKEEPDAKRMLKYKRHATQTEAANR